MKNLLSLLILLLSSVLIIQAQQNNLNIKVSFQTKDNLPVSISEITYIGDVDLTGYDSEGYLYQKGKLTKKIPLLKAPASYLFKKDTVYQLNMQSEYSSGLTFEVDTKINNQVWNLVPAGPKLKRSQAQLIAGFMGCLFSGIACIVIASDNKMKRDMYEAELSSYNLLNGSSLQGSRPEKPENLEARYIVPAITIGFSIGFVINGRRLYEKHRPRAIRIQ